MTVLWAVVALVALQRGGELLYARRNTRDLLAQGAQEVGARHYPLIVALHGAWLLSLLIFIPAETAPSWPLLGLFLGLQALRLWILVTLGRFWTTRIITLPGAPLIRRGPYRFLKHPNYLVVVLEIAVLPLAFGAWQIALVFSILNAILLGYRIAVENEVLDLRP